MERRTSRHTRRVRDLLTTLPVIEAELLAAKLALVERVEDLETQVSDLEFELSTLREDYISIPAPRSLTEEMELESRLSL